MINEIKFCPHGAYIWVRTGAVKINVPRETVVHGTKRVQLAAGQSATAGREERF